MLGRLLTVIAILAATSFGSVLVGSSDGSNCYPFSCGAKDGLTLYQQVYSSSAFTSGPVSINSISFFLGDIIDDPQNVMDSATWTISLSTTSTAVGALSATDPASNVGANATAFGTYAVSGAMPAVLTFSSATPFLYDPSAGNLLMQITVNSITWTASAYHWGFQADSSGNQMSRYYSAGGDAETDSRGLVTRFGTTDDAPQVPEPTSMALMAGALLALPLFKRLRRS